jgi:hypothetical protein
MEILHIIWNVISIFSVIFTVMFVYIFLKNLRNELGLIKDVEKFKQTIRLVYVEQVDGMYRMHDKFTHSYICQATTEEELWELAKQQLPNMKIITADIEVTEQ